MKVRQISNQTMDKKRIMEKMKKEMQKRNQNLCQICQKATIIIKNLNNNKNGWNVKLVRLSLFKATKTYYSSFNAQAKNNLNLQNKRNLDL